MTDARTARFGATLAALFEELDWTLLGRLACDGEGSESFYDEPSREAILDAGLRIAGDLGTALESLPEKPGRSLYIGAAVAELPLLMFETLVARRRVFWCNLPGPEADELNRALEGVSAQLDVKLPSVRTADSFPPGPFDHLWFASVLTDPDHYPALHDTLYERRGTDLATGRGDVGADRRNAARLARRAVEGLVAPGLLVTSDEELPILAEAVEARGFTLRVPERGRTSPVVGDVLRVCEVRG